MLLAVLSIEFLAGFIKLSHTVLLPMCSLLLADCDDTRCEATSRLMALFSGSFCCCIYYDIYCCSHLRHINRRHVWPGHLLDAARSDLPLITARRVCYGERYSSSPNGSGPPNAFLCNSQPKNLSHVAADWRSS